MQGMARGERIAAPVCGLVRNDMIDGLFIHPNHSFAEMPACGSMWVGRVRNARPTDLAGICEAASTPTNGSPLPSAFTVRRGEVTPPYVHRRDPFVCCFCIRLPHSLHRADRVVRPYETFTAPPAKSSRGAGYHLRSRYHPPKAVYHPSAGRYIIHPKGGISSAEGGMKKETLSGLFFQCLPTCFHSLGSSYSRWMSSIYGVSMGLDSGAADL